VGSGASSCFVVVSEGTARDLDVLNDFAAAAPLIPQISGTGARAWTPGSVPSSTTGGGRAAKYRRRRADSRRI
jgi:hypothetical protein